MGSLQVNNKQVINILSTYQVRDLLDNLWARCGEPVERLVASRMVKISSRLMFWKGPQCGAFY